MGDEPRKCGGLAAKTIVVKSDDIVGLRMERLGLHDGKLMVLICWRRTLKDALTRIRLVLSQSHSYCEASGRTSCFEDGSRREDSLCEGVVLRAEGLTRLAQWRIREAKSDAPDRLDKRSTSPTAGRAQRSSESTVNPSKQSNKGFVTCASRIAALHASTARESTKKGCMASW